MILWLKLSKDASLIVQFGTLSLFDSILARTTRCSGNDFTFGHIDNCIRRATASSILQRCTGAQLAHVALVQSMQVQLSRCKWPCTKEFLRL
jgi:hypothetical protein